MSAGNDKTGRWTDAEKNALMVSIVASFGPPNWNNIQLPAGRSRMACHHIYYRAMEEAKGVAMGDNKNSDAVKKRGPKKSPAKAKPKGNAKGKRQHEEVQSAAAQSDTSAEEEHKSKKIKGETTGDDETTPEIKEV
ncbi:MAG: hypothetical protein Q9202_004126 [Teloschistes flavicans]